MIKFDLDVLEIETELIKLTSEGFDLVIDISDIYEDQLSALPLKALSTNLLMRNKIHFLSFNPFVKVPSLKLGDFW